MSYSSKCFMETSVTAQMNDLTTSYSGDFTFVKLTNMADSIIKVLNKVSTNPAKLNDMLQSFITRKDCYSHNLIIIPSISPLQAKRLKKKLNLNLKKKKSGSQNS